VVTFTILTDYELCGMWWVHQPVAWHRHIEQGVYRAAVRHVSTSGKGHLALAVFRCFSCSRASWDILGCLGMSQDALGQLKHLKTARARWPFPDAGRVACTDINWILTWLVGGWLRICQGLCLGVLWLVETFGPSWCCSGFDSGVLVFIKAMGTSGCCGWLNLGIPWFVEAFEPLWCCSWFNLSISGFIETLWPSSVWLGHFQVLKVLEPSWYYSWLDFWVRRSVGHLIVLQLARFGCSRVHRGNTAFIVLQKTTKKGEGVHISDNMCIYVQCGHTLLVDVLFMSLHSFYSPLNLRSNDNDKWKPTSLHSRGEATGGSWAMMEVWRCLMAM